MFPLKTHGLVLVDMVITLYKVLNKFNHFFNLKNVLSFCQNLVVMEFF